MAKMRFKSDIDLDGNKLLNAEVPDLQPMEQETQKIMPSKQVVELFRHTDDEIQQVHTALDGKLGKDENAVSATKAVADGQDRNIVDTYATKEEIPDVSGFATTDALNKGLATKLGKSENATSATKATQDGDGKVISETYATKTELGTKANQTALDSTNTAVGKAQGDATKALEDIGTINTNLAGKVDKTGSVMTGALEVPDINLASDSATQKVMPAKQVFKYIHETDDAIQSIHTALDGKQPVGEYATLDQLGETNATLADVHKTANEADGKADSILLSINNLVPRTIATNMVSGVSVDAKASAVNIVENTVTLADGQTASESHPLPIASGTQIGLMSAEDFNAIRHNTADIEALKGGRQMNYEVKAQSENPTSEELTQLYESIVPTPPIPPLDGTTLFDTSYDKQYTWLKSSSKWIDRGSSQVAIATNSTLGIVKGSPSTAGKGFIEADGTISVYGWDDTVSRIANVEGVASGNTTAISGKVDKTTTVAGKPLSSNISLEKGDVGLGNVDDTSDADKPVSTATKTALDKKLDDTQLVATFAGNVADDTKIPSAKLVKGELDKKADSSDIPSIANLVPNTRKVAGKALTDDITLGPSDVGALAVGGKAVDSAKADEATKATQDGAGNVIVDTYATKEEIPSITGLATKTELQEGLAGKANTDDIPDISNLVPNTRKVAGKELKTDITLAKGDVGLDQVDNTSDADKPISTATQSALDGKATTASVSALDTAVKKAQGDATQALTDAGNADTKAQQAVDGLAGKLNGSQLVAEWTAVVSDTNIPSEKLVKDALDKKQASGDYATKTELSQGLAGKATTGAVQTAQSKADSAYTLAEGKLGKLENAVSATKATQDGQGRNIVSTYATKGEIPSITGLATKEELTQGLATKLGTNENAVSATKATQDGNGKVIADTYATKTELGTKADSSALATVKATADNAMPKAGGTFTGPITINGGDDQGIILPEDANINTTGNRTVFGFLNGDFTVNHQAFGLKLRGKGTNPLYNDAPLALKSEVPSIAGLATTEALNQGLATKLGKSENAVSATKATQDGAGAVITTTYATKTELSQGLAGKAPTGDYATKTELGKKANDDAVLHLNGSEEDVSTIKNFLAGIMVAPLSTEEEKTDMAMPASQIMTKLAGKASTTAVQTAQSKADSAYSLAEGKLGKSENAVSATKATNDGQNRNIATTYATKGEIPDVSGKLDKAGGTMTGNLTVGESSIGTNGYIEGVWLKTTGATKLSTASDKIAVIDPSGWVYYNDKAQLKEALGVNDKADVSALTGKLDKTGGAMTGQLSDVAKGQVHNIAYSTTAPVGAINGDIWIVKKVKPRTWTREDFDVSGSTHTIKSNIRQYFIVGDSFNILYAGEWQSTPIPGLNIENGILTGTIAPEATNIKDAFALGPNSAKAESYRTADWQPIPIKNP